VGCAACGGAGFIGRTAIFEVLSVDGALREVIASGASSAAIASSAAQHGHRSLFDDAAVKLIDGRTSFDEIQRVVGWWVR
jgi:type II secretory ATPase GspE/PulE/Tfp pilus assembly ATPase PilB-like protein